MGIEPKDPYMNFALRNARIDAGYTARQLAEKVGIHGSMIYHYERLRSVPTPEIAKKLSEILNKEVGELFPKGLRECIKCFGRRDDKKSDALDYAESISEDFDISDGDGQELFNGVCMGDIQIEIEKMLKRLSYREREIIKLRYGLGDGYCYTLQEVSDMFKITRERVRQVEARAVGKLQKPEVAAGLVGFLD